MHKIVAILLLFGATALAAAPIDLEMRTLCGETQSLKQYRGRIVVLNFWATWCVPCREEMPLLVDLGKHYGDRIQVIAVSADAPETSAAVPAFVRKHKMPFPVWLAGGTGVLPTLGFTEALPATAFLNADGEIVGRIQGELDKPALNHRIEWMLGNRSGAEPPALENNLNKKKKPNSAPPPPF
jgi:thiol-disulfide isomerase/thioredoxin